MCVRMCVCVYDISMYIHMYMHICGDVLTYVSTCLCVEMRVHMYT